MEIYRWRFKKLSEFRILVTAFIFIKLAFFMFLLNRYYQKLIDNSYFNVKIGRKLMVI